jgi:hypothetical protein
VAVVARYCHLHGGASATQQPSVEQLLHSVSLQLELLASGGDGGGGSPVPSASAIIADDYGSLVAAMPERMRAAATAERCAVCRTKFSPRWDPYDPLMV